ncbi:hypothetical protein ACFX16_003703 [Malus domestica]
MHQQPAHQKEDIQAQVAVTRPKPIVQIQYHTQDRSPISSSPPSREPKPTYATILYSVHVYVCGAIAAAQGIQNLGPQLDFLDEHDVVSGQADNGSVAGIEAVATIRSS